MSQYHIILQNFPIVKEILPFGVPLSGKITGKIATSPHFYPI